MATSSTLASLWESRRDPTEGVLPLEEEWTGKYARNHLPWSVRVPAPTDGGEHRCTLQTIDDLTLVNCSCAPCSGVRDRSHVLEAEPSVVLVVGEAGRERIAQLDTEVIVGAGDVLLWDSTLPASFEILQHTSKTSLILPCAALPVVGWVAGAGLIQLDPAVGSTRLAVDFVRSLAVLDEELSAASEVAARHVALELLASALRDQVSTIGGLNRMALYNRMIQFIADNLERGEITLAAMAGYHCISERTAQRIFAAAGDSIGDAVRRQRLISARSDVMRSNRTLTAVAHRWGYADLSHFSRSFKDAYGYPPSELRRPDRRC